MWFFDRYVHTDTGEKICCLMRHCFRRILKNPVHDKLKIYCKRSGSFMNEPPTSSRHILFEWMREINWLFLFQSMKLAPCFHMEYSFLVTELQSAP